MRAAAIEHSGTMGNRPLLVDLGTPRTRIPRSCVCALARDNTSQLMTRAAGWLWPWHRCGFRDITNRTG